VDGNVKMTLGMIWTIILRFAIQDISVEGERLQTSDTLAPLHSSLFKGPLVLFVTLVGLKVALNFY